MEIKYKLDKTLFKSYANEYYFRVSMKPMYFILAIILGLAVFFLCCAIFNLVFLTSKISFSYALICLVASILLVAISLVGKNKFVNNSVNNFYNKYKDSLVEYKIYFDEEYLAITNNINTDKKLIYYKDVRRVVTTKNIISIIVNNFVYFIRKENLSVIESSFILSKLTKKGITK